MDIQLLLEDRFANLIGEQIDVAIRVGHLPDSSYVARRLGDMQWLLCASPAYLQRHTTCGTTTAFTTRTRPMLWVPGRFAEVTRSTGSRSMARSSSTMHPRWSVRLKKEWAFARERR